MEQREGTYSACVFRPVMFAASRLDKYPLLAIDTEANSCFSIYQKSGLK